MSKVYTLLEFVSMIPAIEADVAATGPLIVEQACKIVQARAKKTIGTDQQMWPPLAPSTIVDKARQGYPTPAPLLRTGTMRDSIEYTVHGNEGCVGSDLEIAVYQELGTSRIPARSFLVSSAISSQDKIERMAGAAITAAFAGHGHGARDLNELLHMLREAGHNFAEIGHDLMGDDHEGDDDR